VALPSRTEQIDHIQKFLEQAADAEPAWSLQQIATKIVDGYHDLLTSGIKKGVGVPHVGLTFKSPFFTRATHVAWSDDTRVWVVDATSHYGSLIRIDSPIWANMEISTAKAGAPGNNPDWKVGDKVSSMQRANHHTVLATGDKCVLLSTHAGPMAESNENMNRFYQKELSLWT